MPADPTHPADEAPSHAWLPPTALRLRTGLILQAQGTATGAPPFEARYLGAIEGKCLFLEPLGKFHFNAAVRAGDSLSIRGFTGQYDFRFATGVLQACDFSFREPAYAYAVIEFPALVFARKVRNSLRIRAAIEALASPMHGLPSAAATIVDLSVEGALLHSVDDVGTIGDLLNLAFSIGGDENLAYIETLARICHRRIGDEGVFCGLLFENIADRDRVLIRELVLDTGG